MHRRSYLRAAGATVALGACTGRLAGESDGDEAERTVTTTDDGGVTAETVATGLEVPRNAAYLDGGSRLIERPDRVVRTVDADRAEDDRPLRVVPS